VPRDNLAGTVAETKMAASHYSKVGSREHQGTAWGWVAAQGWTSPTAAPVSSLDIESARSTDLAQP
jgi:hypothetical protein